MNAKKKGNAGENAFANWMRDNGIKAYRNGSSGGGLNKSDIHNNLDMTIEVKTVKALNLQDAWYQVNRDASIARNMPVLAIHYDGMRKNNWMIVIDSEDWLEYIKKIHDLQTAT